MRTMALLLPIVIGCGEQPGRWDEVADMAVAKAGGQSCVSDGEPSLFGQTVRQPELPPIAGGTLLITRDGRTAVAADPDNAKVWVVDIATAPSVRAAVPLDPGDEPGRIAEDLEGRVHVVLRRAGALLTLRVADGAVVGRRAVCPAPRGVAYDGAIDALHVACVGGELVTLPAAGGVATRTVRVAADLRDVIVDAQGLHVTRFRAAEILHLDEQGGIVSRMTPSYFQSDLVRSAAVFAPAVAWRTVAAPGGGQLMVHQRGQVGVVGVDGDVMAPQPNQPPPTSPYGASPPQKDHVSCVSGIVHSTVSLFPEARTFAAPVLAGAVLPVDVAITDQAIEGFDGQGLAIGAGVLTAVVVAAGILPSHAGEVFLVPLAGQLDCAVAGRRFVRIGQPVAVAVSGGRVLVQTRAPTALHFLATGAMFKLTAAQPRDTGHAIFHHDSGGLIACASCHPEGGDDGRTWRFAVGKRRTMALGGGLLATVPFHWDGDMLDLPKLTHDVFTERMGGPPLRCAEVDALGQWLDRLPAIPPSVRDAAAVSRGRALFTDPTVDCASCHTGKHTSSNLWADVGTGGRFQVPSLVGLAARAPYLHDGCAATVRDRFRTTCGGGEAHGHTDHLDDAQLDDLVAYLESL